jgi:hypothetical protein
LSPSPYRAAHELLVRRVSRPGLLNLSAARLAGLLTLAAAPSRARGVAGLTAGRPRAHQPERGSRGGRLRRCALVKYLVEITGRCVANNCRPQQGLWGPYGPNFCVARAIYCHCRLENSFSMSDIYCRRQVLWFERSQRIGAELPAKEVKPLGRKVMITMVPALALKLIKPSQNCTTQAWYSSGMDVLQAVDRINELLESDMGQTSNTSMRIPTALRDAAAIAVRELGAASSTTALTAAALDDHIRQYPEARPSLGDLAVAAAELDGHPLAGEPTRIRQAALEVEARHPDAEPEDVLLWAEARAIPTS